MQQGRGTVGALRRRRLLAAGGISAGAALLAACGAGTQTGTGSTQAGQSGGSRTLPAATVGWDTFRGFTPSTEWPRMMVESFQAKHPNVKIDARAIALDAGNQQSAYPKMLAMLQAGHPGRGARLGPLPLAALPGGQAQHHPAHRRAGRPGQVRPQAVLRPLYRVPEVAGQDLGPPLLGLDRAGRHPLQHRAGPAGGGHLPGPELPRLDDEQALRERGEDGEVRRAGGGLRAPHHAPRHGRGDHPHPRLQRGQPQPGREEVDPPGLRPQGGHEVDARPGPPGEGGGPPGHLRGRPLARRDAGDPARGLPRRL